MKPLLHFSVILFVFIGGVSCSSSDDDFLIPVSTPNSTPVNTPVVNTPVVNTPVVNNPVVTTVDETFKADLKLMNGVTSMAFGNATVLLDQTTKIIEIHITFSGIEPFLASMHSAREPFVFNFAPDIYALYNDEYILFSSPAHFGRKLSETEIAGLMDNQYYLVLHSLAYPFGEISGTFIKQ